MSVIPFTTQIAPSSLNILNSQTSPKIVLIYTDKMTERQTALMKECQDYLNQNLGILIGKADEIRSLPKISRFFVIPSQRENDLVRNIKSRFEKPVIYLPRAVIEARGYYQVNLPIRNLAISMTMHNCRIFLVKNCDLPDIRQKIHEMCGQVVKSFSENDPNVVISDKADNKYCSKAFKKSIPVVSRRWIDENYQVASEEESRYFNRRALATVDEYIIKPFFGLYFKILPGTSGPQVKKLIADNQGQIIYGNENYLTHIVIPPDYDMSDGSDQSDPSGGSSEKPRIVDEEFLRVCIESGHYLTKREYCELKMKSNVTIVKQEYISQDDYPTPVEPSYKYPPSCKNTPVMNENQAMLPPPPVSRPLRQQPEYNMNDIILRAISEPAQTQRASTQLRELPDPELQIELTLEPSQQLFWNDNASRGNS